MNYLNKIALYIILSVLSLTVQACPSENGGIQQQDSLEIAKKAKELRECYSKAQSENSLESRKQFFEVFPDSFWMFNQLYGYEEKTLDPHILTEHHMAHLSLFFDLKKLIDKETYYEKLIGLGINGHWDADAVGILRHFTEKCVKEDLPLTIATLESYSDQEIKSFWYFLFDGPHPSETIPVDIDKIRSINDRIAGLAEKAFREVHEDAEPHGR